MSRPASFVRALAAPSLALGLLATIGTMPAYGHSRYDRSEPTAGGMVDGAPFVLRAWFTQELMLRSTMVVVDEAGARVDLGDGQVDQDDPDRKSMLVSVPALPVGVYTVYWSNLSAEDGHTGCGTFTFGGGMMPPSLGEIAPEAGLAPGELRSWQIGELLCTTSD